MGKFDWKKSEDQNLTAIHCGVCGMLAEGEDARSEYQRSYNSGIVNGVNELIFGQFPNYGEEGKFIAKVFPCIDQSKWNAEYQHEEGETNEKERRNLLTRREFPIGAPGLLTLQAQALVSSIEIPSNFFHTLDIPFIDLQNDGTARVGDFNEYESNHPTILRNQAMQSLGSIMRNSIVGAFSCELTMKGIVLALKSTAKKHTIFMTCTLIYRTSPKDGLSGTNLI